MGGAERLDHGRWSRLWRRLDAKGDGLSIFGQLSAAYAEPARAYHTAEHIEDCLTQLDQSQGAAQHPDEVETAIWFHDAVYLPGSPDNEDRSAHLARSTLVESGVPAPLADRIAELILTTRHVVIPTDRDAALLCDIDLSILGTPPDAFAEFECRIRREYAWVPEPVYRSARSEILRGFLGRRAIYQSDGFRSRYEGQARQNLERLVAKLSG